VIEQRMKPRMQRMWPRMQRMWPRMQRMRPRMERGQLLDGRTSKSPLKGRGGERYWLKGCLKLSVCRSPGPNHRAHTRCVQAESCLKE